MAENSKIEWTMHTANPWWGCEEVHKGCDHCYARTLARAKGKADAWNGARFATVGVWRELPKWQAAAQAAGRVDRVFCGSMMDIFEKSRPALNWKGEPLDVSTGDLRDRYLREVVPATPNLLHLLLTKRPSNILKMVPREWLESGRWPVNVMTGTSPVDQPTANTLIPQLLRAPGRHFLSMEPLLGEVDLHSVQVPLSEVDWVIVGGESGPKARDFDIAWPRSIVSQCKAAGVPVFVKQMGARPVWSDQDEDSEPPHWGRIKYMDRAGGDWSEWPEDLRVREFPNA